MLYSQKNQPHRTHHHSAEVIGTKQSIVNIKKVLFNAGLFSC